MSHTAHRSRLRSAFTLIELLVVIAIIALLAAILFPVFAQAREKARQAACMSNLKQQGMAILQYTQDFDESFPLGEPFYGGEWSLGWIGAVPPDAYKTSSGWYTPEADNSLWSNSTQPYLKNYGVMNCPSTAQWSSSAVVSAFGVNASEVQTAKPITYTYNGDLQSSSQANVLAPASVIMLWSGNFKTAIPGLAWAMPQLRCPDSNSPCKYVPANPPGSSTPCSTANGARDAAYYIPGSPNYSKWLHGNGDNFLFVDGHIKWSPLKGNYRYDPYYTGNDDGNTASVGAPGLWYDLCHDSLFRPDYVP